MSFKTTRFAATSGHQSHLWPCAASYVFVCFLSHVFIFFLPLAYNCFECVSCVTIMFFYLLCDSPLKLDFSVYVQENTGDPFFFISGECCDWPLGSRWDWQMVSGWHPSGWGRVVAVRGEGWGAGCSGWGLLRGLFCVDWQVKSWETPWVSSGARHSAERKINNLLKGCLVIYDQLFCCVSVVRELIIWVRIYQSKILVWSER